MRDSIKVVILCGSLLFVFLFYALNRAVPADQNESALLEVLNDSPNDPMAEHTPVKVTGHIAALSGAADPSTVLVTVELSASADYTITVDARSPLARSPEMKMFVIEDITAQPPVTVEWGGRMIKRRAASSVDSLLVLAPGQVCWLSGGSLFVIELVLVLFVFSVFL